MTDSAGGASRSMRRGASALRAGLVAAMPLGVRRWLRAARVGHPPSPGPGRLDLGDLRRLTPICREYGWDRGNPVDRHYIETFLDAHRGAVRGRVLEVSEDTYTRQFGGSAVERSDVLHYDDPAPPATIVADLTDAPHIPSDSFDCVICTQTLMLVYDLPAAVRTLHRILKPGGTVLVTVANMTQIADQQWRHLWYWGITPASGERLFGDVFGTGEVEIQAYGNVLSTMAFLHGIACEELTRAELDFHDPEYPMLVGIAARKSPDAEPAT